VTGLILKDSIEGETTIAVSQAIRIDHTMFGPEDISGDADEALATVSDDGMEWAVHVEANNGDIIYIDLPIVNEAEKRMFVEMQLTTTTPPITVDVEPIFYWSDRNHDGKYTQEEAVLDQRPTSDKLELERADIVVATGWTDYDNFTADHWFFDGSYVAPGTYGYGGIYGPEYDDNIFSDYDGEDPEAILLDGNTIGQLDPGLLDGTGDTIVTAGRAALYEDLGSYAIGRILFNDANSDGNWDTNEDIFYSRDGDAFWSTMADVLVDGDGTGSLDEGADAGLTVGDPLVSFDAGDDVYYYDPGAGDIFDGANDALWYDDDDDGRYATSGGSLSGAGAATSLATVVNPSFNIDVDGGGVTAITMANSLEIKEHDEAYIGLTGVSGFTAGNILEIGGNYYIISTSVDDGARSSLELIGDVAQGGDAIKGQTVTQQTITMGAQVGACTVDGAQSTTNGKLAMDVNSCDATGLTAGTVYIVDTDGVLDASSDFIIMDDTGGNPTTSINVLGHDSDTYPDGAAFYVANLAAGATATVDNRYLDDAADIVLAMNDLLAGATASYAGTQYKIDSTSILAASAVVVTNYGTPAMNVADDLLLGAANGGTEWGGGDLAFRDTGGNLVEDTTIGTQLITSSTTPFSYNDGELAAANGVFDLGEDVYEEESGGANTFTTAADLPETVVYEGTAPDVAAGGAQFDASSARYFLDGDNIMYRDTNHDDDYDFGEPLLYTGGSDIDVEGVLTSAVTVLARADGAGFWTIDNANEMFRLETDYDGGAPGGAATTHHYYYVDDNNDQMYTDGEAIIDQIAGADLIRLEKSDLAPATDFVIHHGLANLLPFPLVQIDGSETWKFEVPDVNIIGDPLEIRIVVAIEDAAPTGFYTIEGRIWPVNH